MKRRPKAILFDFDGTLVQFHHDYLFTQTERILAVLDHPPVPRKELEHAFREFDFFRFVLHGDRALFIESFWREFDWAGFPPPQPFPGVVRALADLKTLGIENVVVTARNVLPSELRADMAHTGLLEHVADVHTRAGEEVEWTDKRGTIVRACRALGMEPAETILVGDIPPDIVSAREVGVGAAVAVTSGGISPLVLASVSPDVILPDVTHLNSWLFAKKSL